MQPEKWDITPHVNLLRSLRADRFSHDALIGEAVDNSFDAGASLVVCWITENEMTFQDDGIGIELDRMRSLFSLGEHGAMDTTKLGRFGVGIKSQAVNAGDDFEVETISHEGKYLASVNWPRLLHGGKWEINRPIFKPVPIGTSTGTKISISELRKCKPFVLEKAKYMLAQMFHPALVGGKRIKLNGVEIFAVPDPEITDEINVKLSLSGGRSAHLRAGILVRPSPINRVHVQYRHRVIMPASTTGCGEYSGLTKMFARLQIDGPWTLGKFKNDLPRDPERNELEDAAAQALRPILEKCSSASMSAKLYRITDLINDAIPEELRARPKRTEKIPNPGEKKNRKSGYVDPEKSDQSDGPAKSKRPPKNRLLITFDGTDNDSVGAFVDGRPLRVDLCKDEPFVARLLENRDEELAVRALYLLAMALFEHPNKGELELEEFGKRLSRHLAAQDYQSEKIFTSR